MKGIRVAICILLSTAVGTALAADGKAASASSSKKPVAATQGSCDAAGAPTAAAPRPDAEWLRELGLTEPFDSPTPVSGAPPCPTLYACPNSGAGNCQGSESCYPRQNYTRVDTGLTSCQQPNGSTVQCPAGQTIKTLVGDCAKCPCCFTNPACVCPISCGQEVKLFACGN